MKDGVIIYPKAYEQKVVPLSILVKKNLAESGLNKDQVVFKKSSCGQILRKMSVKSLNWGTICANHIASRWTSPDEDEFLHEVLYGWVPIGSEKPIEQLLSTFIESRKACRSTSNSTGNLVLWKTKLEFVTAAVW